MSEVRKAETTSIVLFDGVCHLCNNSVNFIINRDRHKYFKFTPLQSQIGQQLLRQHHLSPTDLNTLVLIEEGKAYTRSTAALRIARQLSGLWPGAYLLIVVPRWLRDAAYSFIAKNRYKWFGKREACMMPTPDVKERFLGTEDAT
jgi:predicted DCC family thiol-disulfide oxidoreductase YuxK